jgi:hypothetical protein
LEKRSPIPFPFSLKKKRRRDQKGRTPPQRPIRLCKFRFFDIVVSPSLQVDVQEMFGFEDFPNVYTEQHCPFLHNKFGRMKAKVYLTTIYLLACVFSLRTQTVGESHIVLAAIQLF